MGDGHWRDHCIGNDELPGAADGSSIRETTSRPPIAVADGGTPAIPPPVIRKRKHRVFAGGTQSRSAWSRRLILDERFEKHMCKPDEYLRSCVKSFRNPDTRVTGPFSKRDCYQAVRDIVGKELGRGQGKWNVAGAFYSDELPPNIEAGRDMDLYAARLARRIVQVLLPAIRRHGGKIDTTERCQVLRQTAFDVDGN